MTQKLLMKTINDCAPANDLVAVTPSDSTDLADVCRGIIVGAAGNVVIDTLAGTTTTVYLIAGVIHWIKAVRIRSTNTTATGIVAVY